MSVYDLIAYDHNAPRAYMPPTKGGNRDGYASKATPDPRPKQYLSEEGHEVTAMHFTKESEVAVRAWVGKRGTKSFWKMVEYGRWVAIGDYLTSYADWEFREVFKPAILCGYDGE